MKNMQKMKDLKKRIKQLLGYIEKSQKNALKNTQLIKSLERQDELVNTQMLPGFEDVREMCIKNTLSQKGMLIKYLTRSQKAIYKNTKELKKLDKEYRLLACPKLIGE